MRGGVARGSVSRGARTALARPRRGGEFWASLFNLAVSASRAAALAAQDSVASTLGLAGASRLQLALRRALRSNFFDSRQKLLLALVTH